MKRAVEKLKDTNWLYSIVDEASIDEAAKKAIEVVSNASDPMIEKASKDDVDGLQAYTIRKMD